MSCKNTKSWGHHPCNFLLSSPPPHIVPHCKTMISSSTSLEIDHHFGKEIGINKNIYLFSKLIWFHVLCKEIVCEVAKWKYYIETRYENIQYHWYNPVHFLANDKHFLWHTSTMISLKVLKCYQSQPWVICYIVPDVWLLWWW